MHSPSFLRREASSKNLFAAEDGMRSLLDCCVRAVGHNVAVLEYVISGGYTMIPKHLLAKCLAHVPPRLLLTLDHTIISSTDLTAAEIDQIWRTHLGGEEAKLPAVARTWKEAFWESHFQSTLDAALPSHQKDTSELLESARSLAQYVKSLNIYGYHLDEYPDLKDILAPLTELVELTCHRFRLHKPYAGRIVEVIRQHPSLTSLKLKFCSLFMATDDLSTFFTEALSPAPTHAQTTTSTTAITTSYNPATSEDFEFIRGIKRRRVEEERGGEDSVGRRHHLQRLQLISGCIPPGAVGMISQIMSAPDGVLSGLKSLELVSLCLADRQGKEIVDALVSNPHLTHLNISDNSLSKKTALAIHNLLISTKSLTSLDLSTNEFEENVDHIFKALARCSTLTDLNMSENSIFGVVEPLAYILRGKHSLVSLKLAECQLTPKASLALLSALEESSTIHTNLLCHLSLALNTLHRESTKVGENPHWGPNVGMILSKTSTLTSLDLSSTGLRFPCKELERGIIHNAVLHTLSLSANRIGDEGGKVVAKILKKNRGIMVFDISANLFTHNTASLLVEGLRERHRRSLKRTRMKSAGGTSLFFYAAPPTRGTAGVMMEMLNLRENKLGLDDQQKSELVAVLQQFVGVVLVDQGLDSGICDGIQEF